MKTSKIIEDRIQEDARRYITEEHITDADRKILVSYLAEASADVAAVMLARVGQLEAQLLAENAAKQKQTLITTVTKKELSFFALLSDTTIKTNLRLSDEELGIFRELKQNG